jgi:hypothetical protein
MDDASASRTKGTKDMTAWRELLNADPIPWLLGDDNPSVRYLTLVNLLGRKAVDPTVRSAKADIMKTGLVPRILSKQKDGRWNAPGRFYRDKYRGTVWQLIILAECGADGTNEQIRSACRYILESAQDPESHGFAYDARAGGAGGRHSDVIPCLTGNMIWSLLKLGWSNDERVRKGIEWIAEHQRFDDGAATAPSGWPYDRYEMCWGRHSCHLGVVKALKALSAVPPKSQDTRLRQTVRSGCEYLLQHHLYKRSHDLARVSKPGWLRLQFPLMYQTDILEIAGILLDLGVKDERMTDAVQVIVSKQNRKGQWNLEETMNGKYWVSIERKGMPSKWITYRALRVLQGYYRLPAVAMG